MVENSKWFVQIPGKSPTRMRLFCFPFAGGGASFYRPWREKLPDDVEIILGCLPGREQRFGEPVIDTIDAMVAHIHEAIVPLTDLPYAFFGYSMGAIISHHLSCEIVGNGGAGPNQLFLSARRSPDLELARAPLNALPSEIFWQEVAKYGGTPKEILENEEYRQLFEAPLRADFKLSETAVSKHLPKLSCPITVFGGDADTSPIPEHLAGWADATSGTFSKHIYPGGHFFITDHVDAVTAIVSDRLGSVA